MTLGALLRVMMLLAAALLPGCRKPAEQPTTAPAAPEPPRLTLLSPGWEAWETAEAVERLSDEPTAVSAAVRIVRLAEAAPLCVPLNLTDSTARRLRVRKLADNLWALGIADPQREDILHAPLLLDTDAGVHVLAGGVEEELLTLHIAADADIFPHLLMSPQRVRIAALPPQLVMTRASPPLVGFQLRKQDGYPYVALMLPQPPVWAEVARYLWQPYELAFAGPAADALPDPPGGKFALDLKASPLLIPMGGEIPEPILPEEIEDRPRHDPRASGDA